MKKFFQKKYWMPGLLLFGLVFLWNLSQTTTAYAFSQDISNPAEGTYLSNTDIEGGYVTDSDTGITLYYQIYGSRDNRQVSISGYSYSGLSSVTLTLPAAISHGTDGETKQTYTVVGVNGGVFKNFQYLSDVVFADTYEWIGAEAFMNSSITGDSISNSLNLNMNGLKEIRDRAFYGCSQLASVSIGINVNSIGTGVFANCSRLSMITVAGGNQKYCAVDGVLYTKDKTILMQWPAALAVGTSISGSCYIGSEDCPVRIIADKAFEGCKYLYQITGMYSTVTTIGEQAFYGCSNLTRVKIPSTVVKIGNQAFSNCGSGLLIECDSGSYAQTYAKSYGFSTSVLCVVNFYNEGTLVKTEEVQAGEDATAPALPEKSGYTLTWDKSFTNVQQNLNVNASWKQNYTVTFKDAYSGQVSETTSYYGGAVTPPTWTRPGYVLGWDSSAYTYVTKNTTVNAVWLISLTDTAITEQMPKVGDTRTIGYITYQVTKASTSDPRVKAVGCTRQTLTSLTIPARITFGGVSYKVTNIGAGAFRDMPKLAKLTIGANVIKINQTAFYNCPKLKTITISSKKLTGVGAKAFSKGYVKAKVNVPNAYIKKYKALLQDGGLSIYATVY